MSRKPFAGHETKRPAPSPPKDTRRVTPDLDHWADMETADGQAAIRKRMKQREHGRPVRRPKDLTS